MPDHRAPTVVVDIGYKVGAMNEPPGRSGFAHLFEHLMFTGTPAVPDIDAAYGAAGVDINASTWDDHTLYYARGLSSALPYILSVEADRMANQGAAIGKEDLDIQRDVVLNEIRQNVLDNVNGAAWEALPTALFPPAHPYSRSVYGSIPDLEAATLADVRSFFDAYYIPNNAILAIVGDFEPEAAMAMIAETFGRVPRGRDDVAPPEIGFAATRARLELEDKVPTPTLIGGWALPAISNRDLSLSRIAAELLGNPDYGVLRRALIDTGLATNAWAHLYQGVLASRLVFEINAAEGMELDKVEAALCEALAAFAATGLTDDDFIRERRRLFVTDKVTNEDPLKLADNLVVYTQAMDDPGFALEDDRHLVAARAADVAEAVARWMQPEDLSLAFVRPGERGRYPAVLTQSTGVPAPAAILPKEPIALPLLGVGEPEAAPLPRPERAALGNGIEVVHYRFAHTPMTYVAARSGAGTLSAPAGKEGIVELAAGMAVRGAGDLPAAAFGKAIKSLGADINAEAETMSSFVMLSSPVATLGEAVRLFGDALRRPRFDAAEWDIAKAETLNDLALREGDLGDLAGRYGEAALFPRGPGETAIDRSLKSVRGLNREETAALFGDAFSPGTVTFYSVGPQPLDEIAPLLEREFGDWTASAAVMRSAPREPATFLQGARAIVVPEKAATQAALFVAVPAPGADEPRFAEAVTVHRLLNGDFTSRTNSVLREDLAITYGMDGGILLDVRRRSAMAIETAVGRDSAGQAVEEILAAISSLASNPVEPEELQRTVMSQYAAMAATAETGGGLFEDIWRPLGKGTSLEETYARRKRITELDLDAVRAQAVAMSVLDRVLIVAAGDPEIIVPQLEAIGLRPEIASRDL